MQENQETMLFEIEDYTYILDRFCIWFGFTIPFICIVIYFAGGDIVKFYKTGEYTGQLLVLLGIPYSIREAIKIALYMKNKDKREKIQFYPTYIYRTNNRKKIPLDDIQEGYIAKYNTFSNKIPYRVNNFVYFILVLLGAFLPLIFIPLGRFVYSFFKGKKYTIKTNNLLLLQKNYTKYCISVALNIAPKEEIERINQYLNQYLHTDINKIEKILYKIPDWPRKNL